MNLYRKKIKIHYTYLDMPELNNAENSILSITNYDNELLIGS